MQLDFGQKLNDYYNSIKQESKLNYKYFIHAKFK